MLVPIMSAHAKEYC